MVIARKCHSVYFNEGCQFSNGCTFEYVVSLKASVPVFDHYGNPLELSSAMRLIASAVERLEGDSFSVPKLREVLAELSSLSE